MNTRFLLLPISALAITQPAPAATFMSVEQAQALMFPRATLTQEFRQLSSAQVSAIEKASGANVDSNQVHAWKSSTGGWFFVDQVVGKHDYIPFAVALDQSGAVKDVEILEYREAYGSEVANSNWRAQFVGKTYKSDLKLTKDIQNISGATLSSKHITDGVRRLVAIYDLVLANP